MLEHVLAGMAGRLQPDGQHLTAEGYHLIAQRLPPQVMAAIGRKPMHARLEVLE